MAFNLDSSEFNLEQINQDLYETYCSTCKDLFKQSLADCGFVEPLRRLILIGKMQYINNQEVKIHHEEMVKRVQESIMDDSSKLSGLMVVNKSFFYHIVEGSDEALIEVIASTSDLVKQKLIDGAKIIRSSGIPIRYFNQWNSSVIISPGYVDSPTGEAGEALDSDISTLVHKIQKFEEVVFVIASYVRFVPPKEVDEKMNELVPTTVLPFEWELDELYKESFFLTVEKYLEKYLTPRNYTSYLEQEWPPAGPGDDSKHYFEELEMFEKRIDESLKIEEEQKRKKARYGSWWWAS